jgi:general secretion pathway protein E
VRYRVDGVLHDVRTLAPELAVAVVSRVKVMGRMDIAERRVPQDGRATVSIGERPIDLRISTVPTSHGERAVLRLLDHQQQLTEFGALGMPPRVAAPFLERARRANGIILVTGPTGSGKTTTLYATLTAIGSARVNIMTIEDPVEYDLSAAGLRVSQSQVNSRKGVTFATGLRHILRQDPDVVMVGEIRDAETARTAIQASLTGHLVLSTLHTNDAPSALTRLIDLGVEPYLVSASLSAVLAQRLVRRVHGACGGRGCAECLETGLRGRMGVFELLAVSDAVRALVTQGADAQRLRDAARAEGMTTLVEEGARLVGEGATTREEVDRVLVGAI